MFEKQAFITIPSIRDKKYLSKAFKAPSEYVLVTDTHIGDLKPLVEICHRNNKKVIVNLELVGGLSSDKTGIEFLKKMYMADAVIGTSPAKLKMAKKRGLETIQLISLQDSKAMDSAKTLLSETAADAIELRPAFYGLKFFEEFKAIHSVPFLLGGFIESAHFLKQAKEKGFSGCSTSNHHLWQ